ncbi:MAG: alpha-amylase [Syntrophaceae bacterium CG2_30_49_12]|nr:MAG: alpha-amylase [Syntrophaceae bacterium CG2_30_49_12]PIP07712.1 MAG: alpha-amylase [Syntrophobacterales bacterium CG23_combo_of_CG06-09_8_20_14_all_48_27]
MPSVCLYFQVHQPYRLRYYSFFDVGRYHTYEDSEKNRQILNKVAEKCYLPANAMMLDLIKKYQGKFRIAFSMSGVVLDQLEEYRMDVLDSFKRLAETGCVEFLCETSCHSLAFLFSRREFREQVALHKKRVSSLFGQTPVTFRYTELIYNNELAKIIEKMGYKVIFAEGADKIMGWRSPNFVYQPAGCMKIKLLLRNYRLSDDISFRFSNPEWTEYPLQADKFAQWVHSINVAGEVINLFMDYETFGEHQWEETGIFKFFQVLPREILKHPDFRFQTPAEVARDYDPVAQLNVPDFISWADVERDLTAWLGNSMQNDALHSLYKMERKVRQSKDERLLKTWRRLQTSDHFYYMCTKWFADGDVHKYFNPYGSPYDAYINYMNILDDFSRSLSGKV